MLKCDIIKYIMIRFMNRKLNNNQEKSQSGVSIYQSVKSYSIENFIHCKRVSLGIMIINLYFRKTSNVPQKNVWFYFIIIKIMSAKNSWLVPVFTLFTGHMSGIFSFNSDSIINPCIFNVHTTWCLRTDIWTLDYFHS